MASKAEQSKRSSILLAALGYFAGKTVQRSHLPIGATDIACTIDGRVGRGAVELQVHGILNVNAETVGTSTSSPKAVELVAALLAELPDDRQRVKVLDRLAQVYLATGVLAPQEKAHLETAKAWLDRLKISTPSTRAGSVTFAPTTE